MNLKIKPFLALLFLLASGYYFFETLVDTVPSIMVSELMQGFHLNAFELGVLDISYFLLAALIQIPGGYFLDKKGAKKVMPLAACCCTIGLVIFASSHTFIWALLGRMLAGLGSAFGLLGAFFMIANLAPKRWLAVALGSAITIGLAGALLDGPMNLIKAAIGWRELTFYLAGLALIFAFLFATILPSQMRSDQYQTYSWLQFKALGQDRSLWFIALFGGLMYLPAGTLGSLWGANFIEKAVPGLSLAEASGINSLIFLGWMIGSPLAGFCSDYFKKRKLFLCLGALICLSLLLTLFGSSNFTSEGIAAIFLGLGLSSSFSGLTFAMGAERFPISQAMTIGWINMWAILPMLIMNPLFGHILDYYGMASLQAYQIALLPLITLIAIAALFGFTI